ncbi:hypothetical protein BST65_17455 [Bradyrhizobium canariense]|nr:hypothetical protein BST65_17455 [Bradyrhizobium canariense]OSI29846.1 hypothetical protein BST66_24965 [Bradyrhizobium canariense]OSI46528.1 hypothetical protein BSZ20_10560 [Bradyrhizobium canariense]OSI53961.1 hypothetical protein BST67_07965 [Bradyrhizobium canariense]OSI56917.1 hypothetical protein BSZ15_15460 [Bradyrhizobium canariense]
MARLLTELAQINLSCLEARVAQRNPEKRFDLLEQDDMWHAMQYEMKNSIETLIDEEDYGRVRYFVRKYRRPVSLVALATDGLVDEFFSAWQPKNDQHDSDWFNADQQWDTLLDIW